MKLLLLLFSLFLGCCDIAVAQVRQAPDRFTSMWQTPKAVDLKADFKAGTPYFPATPPSTATCAIGSKTCEIVVEVDEDCKVTVNPMILYVAAKDADILWTVKTPDARLHTQHPIVYKGGTPSDITPDTSDRRRHRDRNRTKGQYLYDVWIQRPVPGSAIPQSCGTDPIIVNTG